MLDTPLGNRSRTAAISPYRSRTNEDYFLAQLRGLER